ncbi:MAG: vitamin B12-dependent ribonucleotide reductase, partial [Planctomycetota bacterium]
VKYKQLAGGGMLKIVNQTVPLALETLGYAPAEIESIVQYVNDEDTIEAASDLRPEHLPVFDCAFTPRNGVRSIPWQAHVTMMAAAQPFLSGAISKTVNMPRDTTPEEIAQAYFDGWRLGLKALAIYRDGSKESQPLSTSTEADKQKAKEAAAGKPRRERLPDTRQSVTHKFSVAGHEGYITVGLYPDGRPGEMFITMAKEGSTIGGLMDAFGTAVSMSLQYGVPLEDYVRKFSHMRFEPQGHTKNPDIRIAKSIIDYIFRWVGITFLPGYQEAQLGLPLDAERAGTSERAGSSSSPAADSEPSAGQSPPAAKKAGGPTSGQDVKAESGKRRAESGKADAAPKAGKAVAGPTKTPASPRAGSFQSPANGHNGHSTGNGHKPASGAPSSSFQPPVSSLSPPKLHERTGVQLKAEPASPSLRSEQFAQFQTDAPPCDNCGAITVRNGNCYLCHNCGNSMGCS